MFVSILRRLSFHLVNESIGATALEREDSEQELLRVDYKRQQDTMRSSMYTEAIQRSMQV